MKIEIKTKTLKIDCIIPTSWNDMTAEQVAHILAVFDAPAILMQTEAVEWRLLQAFKSLSKITDEQLNQLELAYFEEYQDEAVFLSDLKELIEKAAENFIEKNEEGTYCITPQLTQNPFPWFKISDSRGQVTKYYAPYTEDGYPLSNCTLNELAQIFTAYETYISEKDEHFLYKMVAIMYRPAKKRTQKNVERNYDGDIRCPLEDYDSAIEKRLKIFKEHTPQYFLRCVEFHIASCRAAIATLYPGIFSSSSSSDKNGDWLDFILELSDYDVLRKDAVMSQNAHDALEMATRLIKKNKK